MNKINYFKNFTPIKKGNYISIGNKSIIIEGYKIIYLNTINKNKFLINIKFYDVAFILKITYNLISLKKLLEKGLY